MIADRLRTHPQVVRHASSAALVLIGALALYNWVLAPHVGCLQAMQKLETAVGSIAEEKDRIGATLDAKAGQRRSLQQELADLEESVFSAQKAKVFVESLLPAVEGTGCTVIEADFAGKATAVRVEEPNAPVVELLQPSLVVSGQSDQISALLQRFRDHRPRVWIDSCQCDFSDRGAGLVECRLVLALYVVAAQHPSAGP